MTDEHPSGVVTLAMGSDHRHVTLRFVPQAWVSDYAIEVDPEGPREWTVSRELMLATFASASDWQSNHQARDDMRFEGAAPIWIRDWSGPFEVELADDPESIWADDPDR